MEDMATFYWSLGVMGIMVFYGICAFVGYNKKAK